jgi:long-chain acyl-CoA synthetase
MTEITRIFDLLESFRNEFRTKKDLFSCKRNGKWEHYSADDYITLTTQLSLGLLASGVKKGDRIATIMVNCPEWNFFDMALMQIGAIQVPIYPTISEENYHYILNDAAIETIIISNALINKGLRTYLADVPTVKNIFSVDKIRGVKHWTEILELGKNHPDPGELDRIKRSVLPTDVATIIYTSGTTGRPKGVMLTHRNFISNFLACAAIPGFTPADRALSFLPLCHVYERMLNYVYQYTGMSVYYAESFEKLIDNIKEVRPHTFAAVPRVLEKIYNRIIARARTRNRMAKALFFWALRQGHKFELNHERGWIYDIKLMAADFLVFRKWRKVLGNNIKLIVSGGASLHPRLTRLFWAARLPVMEGYGLTETAPVIAVYNFKPGGVRFGTVGTVLPGVEVRIAEDGEILCKGPNVMAGYFNRPERTEEVMDSDGWFHTGDIGLLEDGKYLKITDRKKEIFKTSTGRYIAPQVIEQHFKESPLIEHIMVVGENRKYITALIVPDFEYLKNWCEVKGISFISPSKVVKNPMILKRYKEEVTRLNADLGRMEKIKKFRLLADDWTPETGELSLTLKLRRKQILEKYDQIIEQTYRSNEFDYRI